MSVVDPVFVGEVELADHLPDLPRAHPDTTSSYVAAQLLVRFATEPLGITYLELPADPATLARRLWGEFGTQVGVRLAAIGAPVPPALPVSGVPLDEQQRAALPWLRTRAELLDEAPFASVVICSRDRTEGLARTLSAAAAMDYPRFEVVLVDNAPTGDGNRRLIEEGSWAAPVRYVAEPRPGLSWARNAGVHAAEGTLVAFLDDDEIPDRYWLAEYARAFAEVPSAGVATGLILAKSLDTAAERFFEDLGGHSKGRGYDRLVFDPASHAQQHPLYPLPPFGAGGNMCFRKDVLEAIGYFDVALGAGTPSRGGEDTAALADAMLAGYTLVWQPSAFVRHSHYPDFDGAARQLRGYGLGLTAFYTRMVLADPRRVSTLLRLAPKAVGDLLRPGETALGVRNTPGPDGLRRAQLSGLASGPLAYLRSRRHQRTLAA
jgi:glycosyltransferase involved in cell wall biosynthesis